jgi:hydroxyacylglutathione hydrolase
MAENNTIVVPIGLSGVNAFLIKGKRSVLVDTGLSKDSSVIMERISSLGVDPNDISLILLTHCHYDHCGNASYLKKMIGAKVAVHKLNADALKNGTNEEITPFGFKGKLADLLAKLLMPEQPFEGVTPDILIDEEMNLEDFGIKGKAIFTPGHTPGSISVVLG